MEIIWGGDKEVDEILSVFRNEPEIDVWDLLRGEEKEFKPFDDLRKMGWEVVYDFEDSRPREIMELIQTMIEYGAKCHENGVNRLTMVGVYGLESIFIKEE